MKKFIKIMSCLISIIILFVSCSKGADIESKNIDSYQIYAWNIEQKLSQYYINRAEYMNIITTIPNTSGSTSPLIGEFLNDEIIAYYGNLYSRLGDSYYQYHDFKEFVYMSITNEITNSEKFLTADYICEYLEAYEKLKQIRGDSFQLYDANLTTYQKNEYILIGEDLFAVNRDGKLLIIQDKNENPDYQQLMIEKERILNKWEREKLGF